MHWYKNWYGIAISKARASSDEEMLRLSVSIFFAPALHFGATGMQTAL